MYKYNDRKEKRDEPRKERKIRLEIYEDGIYVGTMNTDFTFKEKTTISEEALIEYVEEKIPTYKKKKNWLIAIA